MVEKAKEKRGHGKRGPDKVPRKPRRIPSPPPPPGRGRPKGSKNALPLGAVKALQTCRWRIPDGTSEAMADVADHALSRVLDVLDERVPANKAHAVLKAAQIAREEICGPIAQRLEHSGPGGGPIAVEEIRSELRAKLLGPEPEPEAEQ